MMAKTFMCQHCKKPLVTTPKLVAVGNAFHPECFNELYELQREKDRTRETKLIDKADRDQYWVRFEMKLRFKEAEAKRKEAEAKRAAKALARTRKTVEDVWIERLAGRRFDDAVHVPQEGLLVRGPAF
jgi:hypothetical protein